MSCLITRSTIQHLKRVRCLHSLILHCLCMLHFGPRVRLPKASSILNELLHDWLIDSLLAMVRITSMVSRSLWLRIFNLWMTLVLLHHLLLLLLRWFSLSHKFLLLNLQGICLRIALLLFLWSSLLVVVKHSHFLHELLLFQRELFFSLLGTHSNFVLIDKNLRDPLVPLSGKRKRCYLLLIDFAPFDDLTESIAHVIKFKMGASLRTSVLIIWIVIKVDTLVVHQVLLMINIVCHCVVLTLFI